MGGGFRARESGVLGARYLYRTLGEWIPETGGIRSAYFSLAAPVLLAIALLARESRGRPRLWSGIGYAVGLVSIGLGLSGVVYHLDSPLLSLGGFFGNLVLSLTDHAEDGFFHWTEWIPVASSSFAVAFLAVFFFVPLTERYLKACGIALLVQALAGLAGFVLHAEAVLHGVSRSFFQNVVNGAPPFALLLFPNLMILGLIGRWVIRRRC